MGVLDNVGYVAKATYYPCAEPDPVLVIEAAGQALAPVLLSAATFGCLDFIRMRAGISPWHSRGLRMLINGAIPPEQSDAINKIYKFLIPLEKVLFFWFVVDLTTEFFARWQSQIFRLGACGNKPNDAFASGEPAGWLCEGDFKYRRITYQIRQYEGRRGLIIPPYIIVPPGYFLSLTMTLTIKPWYPNRPPSSLKITIAQIMPTYHEFRHFEATPNFITGQLRGFYHKGNLPPRKGTRQYIMLAATDQGANAAGGSMQCSLTEQPDYGGGLIPVNCLGAPPPGST